MLMEAAMEDSGNGIAIRCGGRVAGRTVAIWNEPDMKDETKVYVKGSSKSSHLDV